MSIYKHSQSVFKNPDGHVTYDIFLGHGSSFCVLVRINLIVMGYFTCIKTSRTSENISPIETFFFPYISRAFLVEVKEERCTHDTHERKELN